jgi:hypothetical protein
MIDGSTAGVCAVAPREPATAIMSGSDQRRNPGMHTSFDDLKSTLSEGGRDTPRRSGPSSIR